MFGIIGMRPIFFRELPVHIHPETPVKVNELRFRQAILAALTEDPGNAAAPFWGSITFTPYLAETLQTAVMQMLDIHMYLHSEFLF